MRNQVKMDFKKAWKRFLGNFLHVQPFQTFFLQKGKKNTSFHADVSKSKTNSRCLTHASNPNLFVLITRARKNQLTFEVS